MEKIDFFEFVFLWFRIYGRDLPKHQRKMCRWMENIFAGGGKKDALLMAFRNSGKSTIVGLFCAWVLYQNRNLRILVLAADSSLAEKMVRNVKHIIEKHPLTKQLKPEKTEEWASDKFTVLRSLESRDPSMLAKGIEANITGLRADLIICDDVEVPNNCDSPLKRAELRSKLDELDYIISPDGIRLFIGTPHTFYTIYQVEDNPNKPDNKPYLKGFAKLEIPILDSKGKSAWPQRFSESKIADIRMRTGENKFLSQMMLKAVDITLCRLNPDDLRFYENGLELSFANGHDILKIGDKRMSGVSCWWDPAFGSKTGDGSVVACVFCDENGGYYLHDLEYIKIEQKHGDENTADLQCERVAAFLERNFISAIHLEINGIGRFLPGILKQKLATKNLKIAVLEEYSSQNKAQRILENFEVLMAAKALNVNKKIISTGFLEEMREWDMNKNCHDDGLDAVAGCLAHSPIRLGRVYANEKTATVQSWHGSDRQFAAFTNFKI